MGKGLIHIYCGDGKGKTTAATGLAVRAAGAGMKVLIARFLKNNESSELSVLDNIPGIDVLPIEKEFGFIKNMDDQVKQAAREYYTAYLESALYKAAAEEYDMLILDEINAAITYGIVDISTVVNYLTGKPEKQEVVLTGRNPSLEIVKLADYVSEIRAVKHPYKKGVTARKGIEF